jgi:group I intron endonuclease
MMGIYQILNTENGKRYIGSSVQISARFSAHKRELREGTHGNSYLQRSFDKYGVKSFEFKQILECERKDLLFYEDLIIKGYKSNNQDFGYNLRKVVESNLGLTRSERLNYSAGDKFNRLTLIEDVGSGPEGHIHWKVKCDCGVIKEVPVSNVRNGRIKSCGCLKVEEAKNIGLNNCGRRHYNRKHKKP